MNTDKLIGNDVAFGAQQTIACLATDFIDPYVSKWFQNRFGSKAKEDEVTLKHTWAGEIIGDAGGLVAFVAIKALFRDPIDALTRTVERVCDPLFERVARAQLKHDAPADAKKLEEYKQFQAQNVVDSSILALSSSAINVVAQRMSGNRQSYGVIIGSKVVGAGLTMATMLGMRTALPDTTKTLDDELSGRYFSKVVRGVGRITGTYDHQDGHDKSASWSEHVKDQRLQDAQKTGLEFSF